MISGIYDIYIYILKIFYKMEVCERKLVKTARDFCDINKLFDNLTI